MLRKQALIAIVAGAISFSLAGYASAQDNSGGGNTPQPQQNDRGSRGSRGNFDPAQWRQRMLDDLKQRLGSSDDEWKVLEPRIEKVSQLQRDAGSGMRMMFGGFGGRDRSNSTSSQPETPTRKAAADLRSALEDKSISADEIAKRLAAYRQAKEQAKQDLVKAQAELKELLSQRQEAQLVLLGMLD